LWRFGKIDSDDFSLGCLAYFRGLNFNRRIKSGFLSREFVVQIHAGRHRIAIDFIALYPCGHI
jgi:hypothetical protein